ncbi:hypothetical protein [Tahibacter amnicola]|uniref:Peptidase MA-like domain-containing protein n=1 Tax=Tahibacter amnicola TaxID=2976241 RepID=A0ABY6BLY4_9GAMM|nr:hypothetical protein [Tahibacter amnicola]UXI69400.1 hypothetical protein N4264_07055 [Tahibacter amnicola]
MKQFLARLFGRSGADRPDPYPLVVRAPDTLPSLAWRPEASLPIPDWRAVPGIDTGELPAGFWDAAATAWLQVLGARLGPAYQIRRSEGFRLLSTLDARSAQHILACCERSQRRLLRVLDGLARRDESRPVIVMIFDTIDEYYDYVGNYYPDEGEFAMSAGMFIQHGYGHFVFFGRRFDDMEHTIVHELTHCLLAHQGLPRWVDEGLAVKMEKTFYPTLDTPSAQLYSRAEMDARHAAYWNARTIQAFWSGDAFLHPDEGSALAYDLCERMTGVLVQDAQRFTAFVEAATCEDAGADAALTVFDIRLGALAAAILGPGDWEPVAMLAPEAG